MTFKKIHKRASTPIQRRAEVIPVLGAATTTTPAAPATTSTSSFIGHAPIEPSGPPLLLTTTTSHTSSSVSASTSASVSSVSTSATSATTSASSVQTTLATTATRTTAPANTVVRSTVRVTASSTTSAATATSTPDSSGVGIGTVAGIAAAAIIAVGVLTAFVIWFLRRRNKNHDIDEEPFNRNSFLRHSTVIPDDDAPLPSRTRPAPTMTERQPVYGGAQTYNDMGQNAFGYNTQPSYGVQPGQPFNHAYGPGGAPATPLPYSPGFGTTYDQQGFNNGGYADLTRGPNHEYPPSPRGYDQYENPHSHYVGHDNYPMSPPIPAGSASASDSVHYPELTPATASAQQGQVVSVRESAYEGRETPVQLGFTPAGGPAQHQGHAPAHGGRPETIYDTDDAYGGI